MSVVKDEDLELLVCYNVDCGFPMEVEQGELGPFMRCTSPLCRRKYMTEEQLTDRVCHLCGKNMVLKPDGMFGPFLSCTGFKDKPSCKGTMTIKYMQVAPLPPKVGPSKREPAEEQ